MARITRDSGNSRAPRPAHVPKPAREPGELSPAASEKALLERFEKLWSELMNTSVHLDSLLSKQTPKMKSLLAQVVPVVLLRPCSQAEAVGVGVGPGEPWSIPEKKRAHWRTAAMIARRMYEEMEAGIRKPEPVEDDFPPAMMEEWKESWGSDVASDLLRVLGREPVLGLRTARELGAETLCSDWNKAGKIPVKAQPSQIAPFGVQLASYAPVLRSEAYEKGLFEIQDEGSQVMALFALWPELYGPLLQDTPGSVKPGSPIFPPADPAAWTVIDACAGAGGKTLALADALAGKGRIYGYDTVEGKLRALKKRASRAGLRNIQGVVAPDGDEKSLVAKFRARADRVLVDAPCTGWGVLRRNPDIKWRQPPEVLARLPELQLRLLSVYSGLVAPGGRLTYGVCTFRRAETVEIVRRFSEAHPEFRAREGGFLGPGPCDGFFMQSFERTR